MMQTMKRIVLVLALLSIIITMLWNNTTCTESFAQLDKPLQKTSIAIVGNGPVSTKHLDEIKNSDQIVNSLRCLLISSQDFFEPQIQVPHFCEYLNQ